MVQVQQTRPGAAMIPETKTPDLWTLTTLDRYGVQVVRHFTNERAEARARLAYADAIVNWWNVAARLVSTDNDAGVIGWRRWQPRGRL
jgi:hypothetical protein